MPTPDSRMTVLRAAALARWLHPRPPGSHKGDNGHVLCVGGDHGSGGAVLRRGHHGMDNMQRRAAGLGATLEVESDAGGTRVVLDLPRSVVRD